MALFSTDDEERTESPSSYRREEFRRQGTVAVSKDLLSVALLLVVGGSLYFIVHQINVQFGGLANQFFQFPFKEMGKIELLELRAPLAKSLGWMLLPVFGVAIVAGVVACAAQVGFYFTTEPLAPKWERIDPIQGFQRLFSASGAIEALKTIFKLGIATIVLYHFFKGRTEGVGIFLQKSVGEGTELTLSTVGKLFFALVGSLAVIAGLDYSFQRFQLEKKMKMTRREAKEEFKLREGDPLIKQRIRNIQRRMASRRMMEAVPKADVVVTNPTHLAIALKYDPNAMAAPRVTAKGAGVIAQKIRELARASGVPLVENKPLARTMFKTLDIGESIPKDLYKAVAEVLAYVYRLKRRLS